MHTLTVRIHEDTHRSLKELADATGQTMSDLLTRAVGEYRRKVFLDGLADDFAALRGDEKAWREELEERRAWEATLADDLDPDEQW